MESGCPAILARSSAEVGGDAALYFFSGDYEELSSVIHRLIADPELREERRVAGLRRASAFTWSETARLTSNRRVLAQA